VQLRPRQQFGYDASAASLPRSGKENKMKPRIALAGLLLGLLPVPARAQTVAALQQPREAQPAAQPKTAPAKEASIRRLMEITGAQERGKQVEEMMLQQLKPLLEKSLPPGDRAQKIVAIFLEKFQARFKATDLLEPIVPIYDKYFTDDDIHGLIQFYESPLGQRVVKILPQVAQESFVVGVALGKKIVTDILAEMVEEYPELKPLASELSKS
jgi:hypothetical protein